MQQTSESKLVSTYFSSLDFGESGSMFWSLGKKTDFSVIILLIL
uniref:Uncharacterized protein n=1 Tax=Arundo donax TaxID=35708 RepID=A0A0A9FHQ8_ARUDO